MGRKVLIITPFYPPNCGGAETFTQNLVIELIKKNFVTVLTYQPFDTDRKALYYEERQNLKIYRLDWLIKPNKIWSGTGLKNFIMAFPRLFIKAVHLQNKYKYDVIISNGLISSGIGSILNLIYKVKHNTCLFALYNFKKIGLLKRFISRLLLSRANKIYAEGKNGKQDLLDLGIKESKIIIYQHWCNQEIFKPDFNKSNHKLNVLCTGRLSLPEKGVHIIKEVERQMKGDNINFVYTENVPYKDMPKYYQMADVVVVPSLYLEGISLVVIEAACCGCAVLTSNRGTLPELVKEWGIAIEPTVEEFRFWLEIMKDSYIQNGLMAYEYAKLNFSSRNAEVFENEL